MTEKLHTKFGTAKIGKNGYYLITSGKEGNNTKYLHRLIWEDFYGCEIPKGYVIHHKNGNKLDNCILNLQLMRKADHDKIHNTGKTLSDEHKQKISEAQKDKTLSEETKQKISENHADVSGENNPRWKNYPRIIKQGFKHGKQLYAIRYEGKILKKSVYLHRLYKFWGENHSDEFLYLEI
jgi:hypothetical protein